MAKCCPCIIFNSQQIKMTRSKKSIIALSISVVLTIISIVITYVGSGRIEYPQVVCAILLLICCIYEAKKGGKLNE